MGVSPWLLERLKNEAANAVTAIRFSMRPTPRSLAQIKSLNHIPFAKINMPTYDYECDACEHKFELYQSIMAPVETKCPKCKKKKLRRLLGTGAAIVFKGSGFYQTDYRSDSYKKSASAESKSTEPAKAESGSSESKGSESKPAATEAKPTTTSSEAKPSAKPSKPKGKKGE